MLGQERGYNNLLIVDHDEARVSRYGSWLDGSGYSWDRAENGKLGFRMSNRCDYGIVIAELNTPDWDAIDMASAMSVVNPNQKVFVVSPDFKKRDEEFLLTEENIIGYDKRPESKEEFLILVRRCLAVSEIKL